MFHLVKMLLNELDEDLKKYMEILEDFNLIIIKIDCADMIFLLNKYQHNDLRMKHIQEF